MRPQKLNVLTAGFNAGPFLKECLESVAGQSTQELPLEHIVTDGASTDGTVDILKAWQNQSNNDTFRFVSEPDRGQADAFNKGVSMATGEWICWLNADDMLAPGAVAAFQKTLKKHPNADVIYGHVQFINEDSTPAWTSYHLPFFYPLLLNGCYTPPSSGTFFRRELFVRNPLDINFHYVMDVEWFLRCGRNLKAICVDQTLSQFRISAEAKTSEMIRSGRVTDRHALERETYRRKYVYSQWPHLTEDQARARFERRQKLFRILYYALKARFAFRYLRDRRMGC